MKLSLQLKEIKKKKHNLKILKYYSKIYDLQIYLFIFFRKMIYKSFSVYRIVEAYTSGYMLVFLLRVTIVTIIKHQIRNSY